MRYLGWVLAAGLIAAVAGPAHATGVTILHTFNRASDEGGYPCGSLTLSGSMLYGTTCYGGDSDLGTVFGAEIEYGGDFGPWYSFQGGTDGEAPQGSLTLSGSTLYGMTNGASSGNGTVFKIGTNMSDYSILRNLESGDGTNPLGSLTLSGSTLYGMTSGGGDGGYGTVFKMSTAGGAPTVLHHFAGGTGDGSSATGSLTLSGTTLYGMTYGGGSAYSGTVFKINTDGNGYQILHDFSDYAAPWGSLTLSADGSKMYGMTCGDGDSAYGTVFEIGTDGNGYEVLHDFTGGSGDGSTPYGSLILSADGSNLYGMTGYGGSNESGVIFRIGTDGNGYTNLYEFTGGDDGGVPYGELTLLDSTLYGMTSGGGAYGDGVVFSLELQAAPEPATMLLVGSGLVGLLGVIRRRRTK